MTAAELRTQLKETFDSVETYKKELIAKISEYDLRQQDLLHYIENETCDAVDLVRIAIKLKEVRAKRRECKVEYERLQSIADPLANVKIHWNKDFAHIAAKKYTNKTDILDSIELSHKNNNTK